MTTRRSLLRRTLVPLVSTALAASLVVSLVACGSRGPLDIEVIEYNGVSGATVDGADLDGAGVDGGLHGDAKSDAAGDARAEGGNPLVNCGQCVAQNCGTQVLTCITDTACRTTLQCVVTMCLGGTGGVNIQCAVACGGGDIGKLGPILAVFSCITGKCGADCASALGGLGGGGRDAGNRQPPNRSDANQMFSAWPELCVPATAATSSTDPRAE